MKQFQLLDVSVRMLNEQGNVSTEVFKVGSGAVTAPEVMVLRTMHGEAQVSVLKHAGWVERAAEDEKLRLMGRYDRREDFKPAALTFPMHVKLPTVSDEVPIPGLDDDESDEPSEADEIERLKAEIKAGGGKLPGGRPTVERLEAVLKEMGDADGDAG